MGEVWLQAWLGQGALTKQVSLLVSLLALLCGGSLLRQDLANGWPSAIHIRLPC